MKNESLGDITLSDVKDAAGNNFKNNKPYSPKWHGSELYEIVTGELNSQSTLVLDEAEPIRQELVAGNRMRCSFPAFN